MPRAFSHSRRRCWRSVAGGRERTCQFVRHFKIRSAKLSKFWGRDIFLRGHVLVPKDFDKHPEARYPLMVFHGHFPADFGAFRTTPPDPDLKCVPSAHFGLPCYNRTEQEEAYKSYRQWIGAKFPRYLVVEIDHSNRYYDDSYAVKPPPVGVTNAVTRLEPGAVAMRPIAG